MTQKLALLSLMFALVVPVCAFGDPGTIKGVVKNSTGVPQMGAAVEITSVAVPPMLVFTDSAGVFVAKGLHAGSYDVRVSAPSFLPSLREDVALRAGANILISITLNTLFEALQMAPVRRRTAEDEDDWKWTVRSSANRSVLRVLDGGPVMVSHGENGDDKALKARVAFLAGSEGSGFGSSSDMTTAFSVEKSIFAADKISLRGNVGYASGVVPGTVVRASYQHRSRFGSQPEVTFTLRRFATPDMVAQGAALQALALSVADTFTLLNFIDVNFGSEYQTIDFKGNASAFRPFGSANAHLTPDTVVGYRYATSVPNTRAMKGFDTAPADLSESGPRMSLQRGMPVLERSRHHEVSISQRMGKTSAQLALYTDHVSNPALTGVGEVGSTAHDLLPDFYSGTFTYGGADLEANGMRFVLERKITPELSATVDYSYGGALTLNKTGPNWSEVPSALASSWRHAVTYKMAGNIPGSRAKWIASYKWTSGDSTLTPVDMFNASAGQSDPYLNVFIRQPIPGPGFLPGHMEALVDVRNLMAQGYVPVIGTDGHTLYLVQSARAIRGGVAFTF